MITGLLFVQALTFSVLSGIVASNKNRDMFGWGIIGFIFGLFGFIAAIAVGEAEDATPSSLSQSSRQKSSSSERKQTPRSKEKQSASQTFDPDEHDKKCSMCAEYIKLEARVCRYCGHEFSKNEVEQQVEEVKEEKGDQVTDEWECRCGSVNSGEHDLCPECGRSSDAVI